MLLPRDFDQRAWLAGVENEHECTRGRMAQDLIDRLERAKPNREAVVRLLGKRWQGKGSYLMCERYGLGLCAGPKVVVLNVCFDDQTRYSRADISYH